MSTRLSKNEAIVVKRFKTDYEVAMQFLKRKPIKVREVSGNEMFLCKLYRNIIENTDSKVVEDEVLKVLRGDTIKNPYFRLQIARAFKQAPRELVEEFITKSEDAMLLNGLTEEDIERHLEVFSENVLYIPDKKPEENTSTLVVMASMQNISMSPDTSVFKQMTIWDILTA